MIFYFSSPKAIHVTTFNCYRKYIIFETSQVKILFILPALNRCYFGWLYGPVIAGVHGINENCSKNTMNVAVFDAKYISVIAKQLPILAWRPFYWT